MPVYTRKGDFGNTYLANGKKVPKSHQRVDIYGTIDELNSAIGMASAQMGEELFSEIKKKLSEQQCLLFELGSELAGFKPSLPESVICQEDILELENWMDKMEKSTGPMKSFILPGGTPAAASLHLSRTICRRLERLMTMALQEGNKDEDQNLIIKERAYIYINRLSDSLFMAARYANYQAKEKDIPWTRRKRSFTQA